MHKKHTLVTHREIRHWVEARAGQPALRPLRDAEGRVVPRLALRFRGEDSLPLTGECEGMSPCSWTQWLAELDRQRLALRVSAGEPAAVEFVSRTTH